MKQGDKSCQELCGHLPAAIQPGTSITEVGFNRRLSSTRTHLSWVWRCAMKLCATPDTFPEETKMNVFSDVTASDQAGSYNKTAAADGGKTAWIFAV